MGESPEIKLARWAWDALIQGGPKGLGEMLAPDAQWHGVEDGQLWRRVSSHTAQG